MLIGQAQIDSFISELSRTWASWREIRKQFSLHSEYVQLAPMLFASHPRPVREAIARHRKTLDRNPKAAHDDLELNDVRVLCAAGVYLGVSPNHIALMDSTTMGLGVVLTSLRLSSGDEIVQGLPAHYSPDAATNLAVSRYGLNKVSSVIWPPGISDAAAQNAVVPNLTEAITESTRLVVLTWVCSGTGVKIPLHDIKTQIDLINQNRDEDRKILLMIDGVHAMGAENFTLGTGLCDIFIAGCHKTLCGPRGTGIVWANEKGWGLIRPTIPPFGVDFIEQWKDNLSETRSAIGRRMTPGGYHCFEHRWALAEAFKFHLEIGKARVRKRLRRLASYCKERLSTMPHVTLITPMSPDLSSAMVCFNVEGRDPQHLEAYLQEKMVIASASPYRIPCIRFSMGLYTRRRDVDAGLQAIVALR